MYMSLEYTYACIYVSICVCAHTSVFFYVQVCTHVCIIRAHVNMYVYTCTFMYTNLCNTCMHLYMRHIHMYISIDRYICIYICVCVYIYMYMYLYKDTYVHIRIHICIYMCMYIHNTYIHNTYIYIYVDVYVFKRCTYFYLFKMYILKVYIYIYICMY